MGNDLELFARAVRCASIVKYAHDRIADLSNFDLRPHAVEIQTCGPDGLRFRASSLGDSWISLGAYELPFISDTAGAGDWCTAGLIFYLFERSPELRTEIDYDTLARALAFGQALSSLNCMAEGARGLLSAWTPGRIIRAARDLSDARVNGLRSQQPQCESRVSEPRLNIFADEVMQWFTATVSNADGVGCCPAP
jgi:fructokinase